MGSRAGSYKQPHSRFSLFDQNGKQRQIRNATGPALDSDSECSELRDNDQDGQHQRTEESIQHHSLTTSSSASASASVFGVSSLVNEGEGVNVPSSSNNAFNRLPTTAKRGSHQRNSSTSHMGVHGRREEKYYRPCPHMRMGRSESHE